MRKSKQQFLSKKRILLDINIVYCLKNMIYRPYKTNYIKEDLELINRRRTKHGDDENEATPLKVLKEYTEQCTVHGLRYVTRGGAILFERLFWIIAVLACVIVAGLFVNSACKTFFRSPIVVNVETTNYPLYNLPFPAVTICPANNVKRRLGERLLAEYLNATLDRDLQDRLQYVLSAFSMLRYPFFYRVENGLNQVKDLLPLFEHLKISEFMLQVLPTCKEVFKDCYWMGRYTDCCTLLSMQRTEAGFCYSFNSLTTDITRNCSTDEFDDDAKHMEDDVRCIPRHNTVSGSGTGLEVIFAKRDEKDSLERGQIDPNGVRIMIHHPTSPPESGNSFYMPENDQTTFSVQVSPVVTSAAPELREMSISTRECIFQDETAGNFFKMYTLQSCLMECRLKWLMEICGCYPYFFNMNKDGVPECNVTSLYCLSTENANIRVYTPPSGTQNLNPGGESTRLNCSYCLPTCYDSVFLLEYNTIPYIFSEIQNGSGHLDVYYKQAGALKYRRENPFSLVQLIVSFGSIMELFLGISILCGIELIYYILRFFRTMYIKLREERTPAMPIQINVPNNHFHHPKFHSDLPTTQADRNIFIL